MTAVRPESSAGAAGQPGYRNPAGQAYPDPLGDPLPGDPSADGAAGHGQQGWYPQQAAPPGPRARSAAPGPDHQGYGQQQGYPPAGYPQAYPPRDAYPPGYAPQQPAPGQAPGYPPQQHPRTQQPHARPQQQPPGGYGYPQQPAPGYDTPQAPQNAPEAPAEAVGVPESTARRRGRLDATAEMPVLEDPAAGPGAGPEERDGGRTPGGRASRRGVTRDADADTRTDALGTGPDTAEPATGGRAERRKAAKRGGAGRRRPPGAGSSGADLVLSGGEPAAPVSRVEARRAAKAAKVSPGVMISQIVGELFITMGVLMLLFVVYQLWYTNVLADEQTSGATNSLQHSWAADTKTSSDAGEPSKFPQGTNFAIIYIPKLDVKAPIAEGTDKTSILDKGDVGHYDGAQETAMPWAASGNFALAGHRNTHGEPFRYINKLVPGDKVVVETKGMYYTYAVTSTLPQTSPANVGVIQPVPAQSGFTGPGRYITLTTCTPEFTSEFRLIVWGKMIAEQPRTKGTPAALLGG
ncbi:class E sortase [Streptomyces sp. SL13]|uniref:Class E sortase n=1 Tax=Streptantibioticus silvisoli TaxID=2705255 RepID=A0AA90H1Z8_9ACTN|nr:class E sortase [Streptantibioticus silvisoli]MDI5970581.1 class E sortase [Streptantibioticus silvisoli]